MTDDTRLLRHRRRCAATLRVNEFGADAQPATPEVSRAANVGTDKTRFARTPLESGGPRYEVGDLLGEGGFAEVWAACDHGLARDIAIKVMRQRNGDGADLAAFLHEARVMSRLEHPGILPVYDLDVAADGSPYFTMRRIDGEPLGGAIRAAAEGATPASIATVGQCLRIVLRVAEAVAFAHHRGLVHQDIKPDNIVLGAFGEVVLVDWGAAVDRSAGPSPVLGTPLYMAPEQARVEHVDARSDVYALGATLFHLLVLRPPTWHDDPDEFWRRKRAGEVDAPDATEAARVPSAVAAIVAKALAPRPEDRYPDAAAFAGDLRDWLDDRAIRARPDTPLQRLLRAWRRHRLVAPLVLAALVAIAVGGATVWRDIQRRRSAWVPAYAGDALAAGVDAWQAWRLHGYVTAEAIPMSESAWSLRDGVLVGTVASEPQNLTWRGPLGSDLRVEWTVTPIGGDTNLNCFLGVNRLRGYVLHLGGWALPHSVTLTRGAHVDLLVRRMRRHAFVPGRSYRVRMERDHDRISLAIDGETVIDYLDIEALTGPDCRSFGFEIADTAMRISDLRVWTRTPPLAISALAAADAVYEDGAPARARARYETFLREHPTDAEAPAARFGIGRCLVNEGNLAAAAEAFARCADSAVSSPIGDAALARRANCLLGIGDEAAAAAAHRALARADASHEAKLDALIGYSQWLITSHELDKQETIDDPRLCARVTEVASRARALATLLELPTDDNAALKHCADVFNQLGDHRRVLAEFPDQRESCAWALLALGREDTVIADYDDISEAVKQAMMVTHRYREIIARFPGTPRALDALILLDPASMLDDPSPDTRVRALHVLGRDAEAVATAPPGIRRVQALLEAERYDEALAEAGALEWAASRALYHLKRWDVVCERFPWSTDAALSQYGVAAGRLVAGDAAGARAAFARADAHVPTASDQSGCLHLVREVLAPVACWRSAGGPRPEERWRRALADGRDSLRGRLLARLRLLLGEPSADDAAKVGDREADLLDAVRADVAGSGAARDGYARWLAQPTRDLDPVASELVRILLDPP